MPVFHLYKRIHLRGDALNEIIDDFCKEASMMLSVPAEENDGDPSLELTSEDIILIEDEGVVRGGSLQKLFILGNVYGHPYRIAQDNLGEGDAVAKALAKVLRPHMPKSWKEGMGFIQVQLGENFSFARF